MSSASERAEYDETSGASDSDRKSPQTSVSIDWVLTQTGPLVDGSVASMKFRENIESAAVSLVELEAWVLQALRRPLQQERVHACQDLIQAVGKRLGLKVHYGAYSREARGWLPFDGLWWLDSKHFVALNVHARRLQDLDPNLIEANLDKVRELGGAFAQAQASVVLVLAEGYGADLEPALRSPAAVRSIRILGVDTLFDIARMYTEGALSAPQLPILFSPFDSMRMGQVVDFLESFVSRYEEGPESLLQTEAGPVLSLSTTDREAPHLRVLEADPTGDPLAAAAIAGAEESKSPDLKALPTVDRKIRLETLREVYGLFKAGRHSECLPLLEKFLSVEGNNPRAWEIYGDLCMKMQRRGEAIHAYGRVLSLAKPTRRISYRLASFHEQAGDLRAAIGVLESFVVASPESGREVRWSIARMLERAGDYHGCVHACDQLLAQGPWDRAVVELQEKCRKKVSSGEASTLGWQKEIGGRIRNWMSGFLIKPGS